MRAGLRVFPYPQNHREPTASVENFAATAAHAGGCSRLWDGNEYTDDFERMVAIIKEAALALQGQDTSDDRLGQELLDYWGIDLSNCQTELHEVEVIE